MEKKKVLIACAELDYILIYNILRDEYALERLNICEHMIGLNIAPVYDLVLLDNTLLDREHWDVKGFISKFHSKVPVILLVSDLYGFTNRKLKELGCSDFFLKPIRSKELTDVVNKWV